MKTLPFVLVTFLSLVYHSMALAQAMDTYDADLDALQLVPPGDSGATGIFYLGIDYTIPPFYDLCLRDLSGTITEVTINQGPPGANGPVLYRLFPAGAEPCGPGERLEDWRIEDWWDPPLVGYVLVRTDVYPEGEVRGDLRYHPFSAVVTATWGSVRALYR